MVRIVINGYNHERLLNAFSRSGIEVFDVKKQKDRVWVTLSEKDLPALIDLCGKMCYTFGKAVPVGRKKLREALVRNLVLIFGMLFAVIVCVVASGKTGRILLVDQSEITSLSAVTEILESYGVKRGSSLSAADTDYLENQLALRIEGAEYVILSRKGRDLTVTVTARKSRVEPIDSGPRDISAVREGVVSRIAVIVGTPAVAVGDKVVKGQVLIRGVVTYADGTEEPVRAEGRVYASVSLSAEVVFVPYREVFELTGRTFTTTSHEVFGKTVGGGDVPPFRHYETKEFVMLLSPAPIKRIRTVYYELRALKVSVSFDEERENLRKKAAEIAEGQADFEITERVYSEEASDSEEKPKFVRVVVRGTALISESP